MEKVQVSAFMNQRCGLVERWVPVLAALVLVMCGAGQAAATVVRMQTDLGSVDIELFDTAIPQTVMTPQTVANFLNYVNDDDYYDTFIQLSARLTDPLQPSASILQMGGYRFDPALGSFTNNTGVYRIPVDNVVVPQELGNSNLRGTLTMARRAGEPDSAGSEFFINLVDNTVFDTSDGGFAVFGRVIGDGMDVIDAISALERCKDIGFLLPAPCNNFPYVPLVAIEAINGAQFTTPVENANLVNLYSIGVDGDGDGITDRVEDSAPGPGDGNGDSFDDSTQQDVASFLTQNNNYVTVESAAPAVLSDSDVLGLTFAFTTLDPFDPNNPLADKTVLEGFFGTTLTGLAAAGDSATLTMTLPVADVPGSYMVYGPEPGDAQPHWYELEIDGQPGVTFDGSVATLTFIDGQRGDADLTANGVIIVSPGGPVRLPGDIDGIPDVVENAAPNDGDGNADGTPDRDQDHVVSLPDLSGEYLTLVAQPGVQFDAVSFVSAQSVLLVFDPTTGTFVPNPDIPPGLLNGANFSHDVLRFTLRNFPGASAEVQIIVPGGERPFRVLKLGPTTDDPSDHFYDFSYDATNGTGARFSSDTPNVLTLHLVDGGRGDSDLVTNGEILDPVLIALPASVQTPGGGGGGCALRSEPGSAWQGGDWWLLVLCMFSGAAYLRFRN